MKNGRLKLAALVCVMAAMLSGCFFRGVDQLYAIPNPPADYQAIQARLSEVISQGAEYAAPLSGDLIQSVQLQDLDGDGKKEAIAFFRLTSDEKPMKIHIFRPVGDNYETMAVIEGAASAVNRVDYVQMDDEPYKEIVISWQLTANIHALSVYSIGPVQVEELVRTDYDSYKLCDLDQDNQQELMVFRTPTDAAPKAELYDFDGVLTMTGSAPISLGAYMMAEGTVKTDYLTTIQTGYLQNRVPALFATSSYGDNGAITDVYVERDGKLKNVTLDPATGESTGTIRYYTQAPIRDVNGDGVMEIPQPVPIAVKDTAEAVSFWLVRWLQFNEQGQGEKVLTTYYNDRDGWYFSIPEEWEKELTLSRLDLVGGGERAVTFSRVVDGEAKPFLTIYRLTGTNRATRAKRGQRFIIMRADDGATIYAAEFRDGWDCGLTEEDVIRRFSPITTDWYNG